MTIHLKLYQVRRTLIILKDDFIQKYNKDRLSGKHPTRIQSKDKATILQTLSMVIDMVENDICKSCNQCTDKTKCDGMRGKL